MKLILSLSMLCFTSLGCEMGKCTTGKGPSTTTELAVAPFQRLVLKSSLDVRLVQGAEQKVEVQGPSNLAELVNTQVVDGTWTVEVKECFRTRPAMFVLITIQDLQAITIQGSGNIQSKGAFIADALDLTIQGSGDMDLDLSATRIKATVQGSGDVLLRGSTSYFETRIQGSGDVNTLELAATDVKASIMGSGDVAVQCNGVLDASIMGSGNISYRGIPTEVLQSIKGSGSIRSEQ